MKHLFSLLLLTFIFSVATVSVAYSQILTERDRATLRDEILKDRFDNLLPQLMDDIHDLDQKALHGENGA